jgi:pyruvate/2-oxoglutarate dehydrogenase complex dihydrolipoamide dehydrogenase (E3) component
VRRANELGVMVQGPVRVDMKRVNQRMRRISAESTVGVTVGVTRWLEGMNGVDLYRGHATFDGPRTVSLKGELLSADNIFINVGTRSRVPEIPGLDDVEYLTNTSMMKQQTLPAHLLIVGASYIGLEFAQIFPRFGGHVTVVERGSQAIARDDEDVSATVRQVLEGEGVRFRFDVSSISLAQDDKGVAPQIITDSGPSNIHASHVQLAVGRVPNTDGLALEKAGIETDSRG